MKLIRSLLFVPASRPDRFAKACQSSADLVCIDLEDAVAADDKVTARQAVMEFLQSLTPSQKCRICVRINPLSTALGENDLAALATCPPGFLLLAKCQSSDEVQRAANRLLGRSKLIALIESIAGLSEAPIIACSSSHLVGLMFGGADLSAELGCSFSYEPLLLARCQLVQAGAAASLQLIDVPFIDLEDTAALVQETKRVRSLGFTGKAAIHPKQIDAMHQALMPSQQQLTHARAVVTAAAGQEGAVLVVDGKMIDRPVLLACQRVLAYAGETAADDKSCAH